MNEEYPGGGFGGLLISGNSDQERYEELHKIIRYASERRFQLGIHATGDRGHRCRGRRDRAGPQR